MGKTHLLVAILLAAPALCKPAGVLGALADDPRLPEMLFGLLMIFLVYNYVTGKRENKAIARKVFLRLFGLLTDNFAYIGTKHTPTDTATDPEAAASKDDVLEQDYPHTYRVFLTGRETVQFGILNVSLNRRQDFISNLVYSIFWPEKDKVQFECALDAACVNKGIVYLVRAKQSKKAIEDFEDLRTLAKRAKPDEMSRESLSVFAESSDVASVVFDPTFCDLLNGPAGDLVEAIVVTDCVASEFYKGPNARLVINLGKQTDGDLSKVEAVCSAFLKALDRYAAFQPSKRVQEEVEEGRKRLVALRDKRRKADSNEGAKSLAERYSSMTPAEKKKFEEKEARKAKAKSKMVKMVKGA